MVAESDDSEAVFEEDVLLGILHSGKGVKGF